MKRFSGSLTVANAKQANEKKRKERLVTEASERRQEH